MPEDQHGSIEPDMTAYEGTTTFTEAPVMRTGEHVGFVGAGGNLHLGSEPVTMREVVSGPVSVRRIESNGVNVDQFIFTGRNGTEEVFDLVSHSMYNEEYLKSMAETLNRIYSRMQN